eukprot:901656-Amphidinium_carterae.1
MNERVVLAREAGTSHTGFTKVRIAVADSATIFEIGSLIHGQGQSRNCLEFESCQKRHPV